MSFPAFDACTNTLLLSPGVLLPRVAQGRTSPQLRQEGTAKTRGIGRGPIGSATLVCYAAEVTKREIKIEDWLRLFGFFVLPLDLA